jgi:hypothetical protein
MKQVHITILDLTLRRLPRCPRRRLSRLNLIWALWPLLGLATGCASLVGGTHRDVVLRSNPEGAKVTVVNAQGVTVAEGVTPFTANLRKGKAYFAGQHYTLMFRKEGFCDMQQQVESTVSGWYFGNLLFGGAIGLLIVDPHTGGMYTLPKEVSAQLTRTTAASAHLRESPGSNEVTELRAIGLQDVPASLRAQLIKVN